MAQTQSEDRRSGAFLFAALILLTLALAAVMIGGFWGDRESELDLTQLQTDVSDLQTGPGSPTN